MRPSISLRKLSNDPFKTHVGDRSPLWKKVREALVVNPEINTGSPLVLEHRWPQPASRPETFTVPASRASDIAQNAYWQRDFRRMYPKTAVVTQAELATLLIAQGGFTSLPAPPTAPSSGTALTADSPAPTLSAIYASPSSVSSGSFRPPLPPGNKYKWAPAHEVIPHNEYAYYPMYASSATKIN